MNGEEVFGQRLGRRVVETEVRIIAARAAFDQRVDVSRVAGFIKPERDIRRTRARRPPEIELRVERECDKGERG